MKKLITIAAAACAAITLILMSCNPQKKEQGQEQAAAPKYLVLYYSQTGATKAVAEALQRALGADIEAIEAEMPYDGDYDATIQRCIDEQASGAVPAIKPVQANIGDYDVVFIGYPVWFGTYAPPVKALLAQHDFAGKKVVPFCTFGSGGLEASAAQMRAALPKAEVADGYGVRNARLAHAPYEVGCWLVDNGYVEGQPQEQAAYGEAHPVTEEEAAIFEAACGDYPFPLGTPVTASKRQITYEGAQADEYMFTAESVVPGGDKAEAAVYVLVPAEGAPEFTRVAR